MCNIVKINTPDDCGREYSIGTVLEINAIKLIVVPFEDCSRCALKDMSMLDDTGRNDYLCWRSICTVVRRGDGVPVMFVPVDAVD